MLFPHKPAQTLKPLFINLKCPISQIKTPHFVHEISCNNCDKSYIGLTIPYLESRLNGHKYNGNLTLKNIQKQHTTSITKTQKYYIKIRLQ